MPRRAVTRGLYLHSSIAGKEVGGKVESDISFPDRLAKTAPPIRSCHRHIVTACVLRRDMRRDGQPVRSRALGPIFRAMAR